MKTAVILAWAAASYVLLVFAATAWWQAVPLAVSLGLALAAIGFCIQHDGGHRAYSRHSWVNRAAAATLDLLGASSYVWDHKHNSLHHTYANIAHHDDDIELGVFGRLAPHQPRYFFHRWQHLYLWALYGLLPMKWHFVDDFAQLIRGRIGEHRLAPPRGARLVQFVVGKLVFFVLALGIPLFLHPWWQVLAYYLLAFWVCGIVISITFQLAHVVEEAEFPEPEPGSSRMSTGWAAHQVKTTVDFARRNPLLTWYLGGLNYQVEHHLFPRICHVHYPHLSRIVERTCRRYGLRYNAHRTLAGAVGSHYRWLRRMGRSDAALPA